MLSGREYYTWLSYDIRLFITQPRRGTGGFSKLSPDSIGCGPSNWMPAACRGGGGRGVAAGAGQRLRKAAPLQTCLGRIGLCACRGETCRNSEEGGGRGGRAVEGFKGEKNVVINRWQQIHGEDYWTVTQQQMSDECLLTCFLHLGGRVADEFRAGGLVTPNRRGR